MLKSTQIKLEQNNKMIFEQKEANGLKKKELEETKRHNLVEEKTKDRVDISKQEYLELLKQVGELRADLCHANSIIEKIFKPLVMHKISESVYNKILDNKFKVDVSIFHNPMKQVEEIRVIYSVPMYEYE